MAPNTEVNQTEKWAFRISTNENIKPDAVLSTSFIKLRVMQLIKRIRLLLVIFILFSCSKNEKLGRDYHMGYSGYLVDLKRINSYPGGTTILVEKLSHRRMDSSTIYKNVCFNATLPIEDTSIGYCFLIDSVEYEDSSYYFKWKMLASDRDSLSGGITPKQTTKFREVIYFKILY